MSHAKNQKLKVVLLCSNWEVLKSVYQAMKTDDYYEVKILSQQDVYLPSSLYEIEKDTEVIPIYNEKSDKYYDIAQYSPDIIIIDRQYCIKHQVYYPEVIKLISKICLVPYGFVVASVDKEKSTNGLMNYSHFAYGPYWKTFLGSQLQIESAVKEGNVPINKCINSGYPRLDLYNTFNNPSNAWSLVDKPQDKVVRVLWTPHHSIAKGGYSQFLRYMKYMIDFAGKNPNFDIVLKPHPGLFPACLNYISQQELEDFKKSFLALPNTNISDNEIIPLFQETDVLINDSCSFLADFLITEKPMILLTALSRRSYNLFGEEVIKGYYQAKDESELNYWIEEIIIKGKDPLLKIRQQKKKECLHLPPEGAGAFIKNYLKDNFKINKFKINNIINNDEQSISATEVTSFLCNANLSDLISILDIDGILKDDAKVLAYFKDKKYFHTTDAPPEPSAIPYNTKESSTSSIHYDWSGQDLPKVDLVIDLKLMNNLSQVEQLYFLKKIYLNGSSFLLIHNKSLLTQKTFFYLYSRQHNDLYLIDLRTSAFIDMSISRLEYENLTEVMDMIRKDILQIKSKVSESDFFNLLLPSIFNGNKNNFSYCLAKVNLQSSELYEALYNLIHYTNLDKLSNRYINANNNLLHLAYRIVHQWVRMSYYRYIVRGENYI